MKFFQTILTLVSALSITSNALPIPTAHPSDSIALAPPVAPIVTETDIFKHVNAVHPLEKGKRYVFTMETPLGAHPDAEEEFAGLRDLQAKLGFEHVYLVVAEVKETTGGPPKKPTIKRDFVGMNFHMFVLPGKEQKIKTDKIGLMVKSSDLKRVFRHVKDNTGRSDKAIGDYGKLWEKDHPTYHLNDNNCKSYVDFLLKYV